MFVLVFNMPATSKAQQRFFGLIYNAKKNHDTSKLSGKAKDASKNLTTAQSKDFAETKTSDLPDRAPESSKLEYNRKVASLIAQANYWFGRR